MSRTRVTRPTTLVADEFNMGRRNNMQRLLQAASDAGDKSTRRLPNAQILNGHLLEGISLTSTAVNVPHLLNRVPRGWIVVSKNTNEDIWSSSSDSKTILLDATGNVTVTLWVF